RSRRSQQGGDRRAGHRQRRSVRRRMAPAHQALHRSGSGQPDERRTIRGVRPNRREMKFLPVSDADRTAMLQAIGVTRVEDLFRSLPREAPGPPAFPPPMPEIEIRRLFGDLSRKTASARDTAFFLGAGLYHHYVSAIADQMLYRSEWLTSYTPYQPEVSQGT